jgi:hypothetical protein
MTGRKHLATNVIGRSYPREKTFPADSAQILNEGCGRRIRQTNSSNVSTILNSSHAPHVSHNRPSYVPTYCYLPNTSGTPK